MSLLDLNRQVYEKTDRLKRTNVLRTLNYYEGLIHTADMHNITSTQVINKKKIESLKNFRNTILELKSAVDTLVNDIREFAESIDDKIENHKTLNFLEDPYLYAIRIQDILEEAEEYCPNFSYENGETATLDIYDCIRLTEVHELFRNIRNELKHYREYKLKLFTSPKNYDEEKLDKYLEKMDVADQLLDMHDNCMQKFFEIIELDVNTKLYECPDISNIDLKSIIFSIENIYQYPNGIFLELDETDDGYYDEDEE